MQQLTFVTGNKQKLTLAENVCETFGIQIVQEVAPGIVEIQAETGEPVARHKANEAYRILGKPLVITDDTWIIPALNGFPGPYMKSINHWFSPEDWLRLMNGVADRRAILQQIIVYQDADGQQLFSVDIEGVILDTIRGESSDGSQPVFSMDGGRHSIAEAFTSGRSTIANKHTAWHKLAAWLTEKK